MEVHRKHRFHFRLAEHNGLNVLNGLDYETTSGPALGHDCRSSKSRRGI